MKFFNLFSITANSPAIKKLADKSLSNKAKSLIVGGETDTQGTESLLTCSGGGAGGWGCWSTPAQGGDRDRDGKRTA